MGPGMQRAEQCHHQGSASLLCSLLFLPLMLFFLGQSCRWACSGCAAASPRPLHRCHWFHIFAFSAGIPCQTELPLDRREVNSLFFIIFFSPFLSNLVLFHLQEEESRGKVPPLLCDCHPQRYGRLSPASEVVSAAESCFPLSRRTKNHSFPPSLSLQLARVWLLCGTHPLCIFGRNRGDRTEGLQAVASHSAGNHQGQVRNGKGFLFLFPPFFFGVVPLKL